MFATSIQKFAYKKILKPVFFKQDPEKVHERMTVVGVRLGKFGITQKLVSFLYHYKHAALMQNVLGINFANPVGLAAGFDKNAELTDILPSVGFGFEEVGSITGERCEGNPKPRLWRLPKSKGLVVYYGLKNDGAVVLADRLRKKEFKYPIGISIAKTNDKDTVELEAGISDYAKAFKEFVQIGDYFTINISCPNAFGGEPFASPERLDKLLERLDKFETDKPVFLKLAADTTDSELDELIKVMDQHRVHGVVISNLTKKRDRDEIDQKEIEDKKDGGISGRPTFKCSNDLICQMYKKAGDRYVIIGVGGIFSAEDAYEKIRSGATLVQLITGMIFEGPQVIGEINRGLVELLQKDGYINITDAIGSAHK